MNIALSKSRFKQGLECPNKLFFSNNSELYHNVKKYDTFLQALASGGFQIEEYARLQYPEGILIDDPEYREDYDYQDLADQTTALLQRENVVDTESNNTDKITTTILFHKHCQCHCVYSQCL